MRVSVEVYTKDIDAALVAVKRAFETGACEISLRSSEDYQTNEFEYLSLEYKTEHSSPSLAELDEGPFVFDTDKFEE